MADGKQQMIDQYNKNKAAHIGLEVKCPCCNTVFKKKTCDHCFCSNGRTKGAGNCKDAYWNKVDENKRNRKHPKSHYDKYNVGEKSYKNRFGTDASGWPMGVDEGPEGWDGHKD